MHHNEMEYKQTKKVFSYLISVFVFALLPFDCVAAQIRHYQREWRVIRVGLRVVCCAFGFLLSTGRWFKPLGHFSFPLTDR